MGEQIEFGNSTSTDDIVLNNPPTSIDDLLQIRLVLLKKEQDDLALINITFKPDDTTLKDALIDWATIGFPSNHIISSVQINPPPKCSDGVTRNFYFYTLYLAGVTDMNSVLSTLNTRVDGMEFSITLVDVNTINLVVSKITA